MNKPAMHSDGFSFVSLSVLVTGRQGTVMNNDQYFFSF